MRFVRLLGNDKISYFAGELDPRYFAQKIWGDISQVTDSIPSIDGGDKRHLLHRDNRQNADDNDPANRGRCRRRTHQGNYSQHNHVCAAK